MTLQTRINASRRSPNVLVAGGAGFIGSHLCDALLQRGHTVICLDNLFTGRIETSRPCSIIRISIHRTRRARSRRDRDEVDRSTILPARPHLGITSTIRSGR